MKWITTILITLSILPFIQPAYARAPLITLEKEKPLETPNLAVKQLLKHEAELLKLEQCESGGQYRVVLDTNHEYSYGWLQFQMPTFRRFAVDFGYAEKDAPTSTLERLIHQRDIQFEVADKILSTEKDGWKRWWNCWQIVGNSTSSSVSEVRPR